jgi:hypothetical protein
MKCKNISSNYLLNIFCVKVKILLSISGHVEADTTGMIRYLSVFGSIGKSPRSIIHCNELNLGRKTVVYEYCGNETQLDVEGVNWDKATRILRATHGGGFYTPSLYDEAIFDGKEYISEPNGKHCSFVKQRYLFFEACKIYN